MALRPEDAVRRELRRRGKQNENMFVFACKCGTEIFVPNNVRDLNRATGNCRRCANAARSVLGADKVRLRPFESLHRRLVTQSTARGLDCSITYEQFLLFTAVPSCHYCGDPVEWKPFRSGHGYNLDRKYNWLGYSEDNTVVCCAYCNRTKAELTYEQMMLLSPILSSEEFKKLRTPMRFGKRPASV